MPVIEPKDPLIKSLVGLHLWHDDLSSCSQRVRTVLALKGLDWEDHLLAIPKGENTTPEFLAINSKGLVPVLVHDGVLRTESIDIIEYLDGAFPDPALHPSDPELVEDMLKWMRIADGAQYDLKVLSHEFLFRAVRKVSSDDMETFESDVENDVLTDFIRVYRQGDRLPEEMVVESVNGTDKCFRKLDEALADREWLVGDAISLADIAWMPNAHRFELMDWPMDRYSNVKKWHGRVKETAGYKEGILKWEPPPARQMLNAFARSRASEGYHVRSLGVLAD